MYSVFSTVVLESDARRSLRLRGGKCFDSDQNGIGRVSLGKQKRKGNGLGLGLGTETELRPFSSGVRFQWITNYTPPSRRYPSTMSYYVDAHPSNLSPRSISITGNSIQVFYVAILIKVSNMGSENVQYVKSYARIIQLTTVIRLLDLADLRGF